MTNLAENRTVSFIISVNEVDVWVVEFDIYFGETVRYCAIIMPNGPNGGTTTYEVMTPHHYDESRFKLIEMLCGGREAILAAPGKEIKAHVENPEDVANEALVEALIEQGRMGKIIDSEDPKDTFKVRRGLS